MNDPNGPYADLGALAEVAAALGVSRDRIKQWILRVEETRCPQPVLVLTRARVYSISEWQAWFALWRISHGPESRQAPPAPPRPAHYFSDTKPPRASLNPEPGRFERWEVNQTMARQLATAPEDPDGPAEPTPDNPEPSSDRDPEDE
jgi:hypothetical protein